MADNNIESQAVAMRNTTNTDQVETKAQDQPQDQPSQQQAQPGQTPAQPQPGQQQGQPQQQQQQPGQPKQPQAPPTPAPAPQPTPQQHPAVQRASLLHSVAESLAGGPRYQTTVDPNTGETKRTAVPLSGRSIGMAIALEAISGGLAGMAGHGPGGVGQSGLLGLQQGQKIKQERQQQEDRNTKVQEQSFANKAAVAKMNMAMAQNQRMLAKADREVHQMDVDGYAPMYKEATTLNAVGQVVSQAQLYKLLGDESLHITKDMAIPIQVVESVGPDGKPLLGDHGERMYEKRYAILKPNAQITMPPETMKILVDHHVQGYVKEDGKTAIDLPNDTQYRLHLIADGINKANNIKFADEAFRGYANGQSNPLHKDTAPGGGTVEPNQKVTDGLLQASTLHHVPDLTAKIDAAADKYNIPRPVLQGLVFLESSGDPKAKSPAGALGLGQLMPANAKKYGVHDPYNPDQNLEGAAHMFSDLIKEKGSIEKALKSYHGYGSDGNTTEDQYVKLILGPLNSKPVDPAKAEDVVKTATSKMMPDDYKTIAQVGGISAFMDGKPGEPSTAQKLVDSGKIDGQSVGRVVAALNSIKPIDDVRREREQANLDMQEASKERIAQKKMEMEKSAALETQKYLNVPDQFVYNPDVVNMAPKDARAALEAQGVTVPEVLGTLQSIAQGKQQLQSVAVKTYKGTFQMNAAEAGTFIKQFLNPNYEEGLYKARANFIQDIWSDKVGTFGGTMAAAGTATHHMDQLEQVSTALHNNDTRLLNTIKNELGVQLGAPAPVVFKALAQAIDEEVTKVTHGGVPLQAELKQKAELLNENSSPEQIDGVINGYIGLMNGRIQEIGYRAQEVSAASNMHGKISDTVAKIWGARGLEVPGWGEPIVQDGMVIGMRPTHNNPEGKFYRFAQSVPVKAHVQQGAATPASPNPTNPNPANPNAGQPTASDKTPGEDQNATATMTAGG